MPLLARQQQQQQPKFGWVKAPPKESLVLTGKVDIASPLLLNVIEAAHWMLSVPLFASSYAVLDHFDTWLRLFDGDTLRVFLWLVSPIIMSMGTLAPIFEHIYEDWQIAPSVDPQDESYNPDVFVNERLREISYSVLMVTLGVANIANVYAYQGLSPASSAVPPLLLSLGLLAYGCLGDKQNLLSRFVTPRVADGSRPHDQYYLSILPRTVSAGVFSCFSYLYVWWAVTGPLLHQLGGDHMPVSMALLGFQILTPLGGIIEGQVAEVEFDQRYHFLSATLYLVGAACNAWSLFELGRLL
jgi:hypothetical protein